MLKEAIERCPADHWETKIGAMTFRQVAYHTLFFTDLYLSADEAALAWRDVHQRGGDERNFDGVNPGLPQADSVEYCLFCRDKAVATMNRETADT